MVAPLRRPRPAVRTVVAVQPRPLGIGVLDDVVDEATGHGRRRDPVAPRTGGPAGNAALTSWAGLLLLVLIAAELVTLLDVIGLMSWHVGVGIALVALALLKTASTGWRIVRYYTGSAAYRSAGPPPLLLRLLGPLVIVTTLGVLGSGIALIALGQQASRRPLVDALGFRVDAITVHQAFFVLFAVFTGLHLLARFVPALRLASGRRHPGDRGPRLPGATGRAAVLVAAAVAGVVALVLVLPSASGWHQEHRFFGDFPGVHHHEDG